jgi:uncharacterized protein (TIGR02099 family)
MSTRSRKIFRWLLGSLVTLVIVLGLLFVGFGIIVGRVPEYRVQLQDWISERSGLVVEFRSLNARLRLYGPELAFSDAVVRTPDRTRVLATARRGSVAFDLWNSIRTGRLTAGRFTLSAPQIGLIRTREGRIELAGQSALPERSDAEPFAIEQLPTGHFRVTRAVVSFRDEITGRGPWSLSGVSFDLYRDPESLRLLGDASLPNALGRKLEFSATVEGALEDSAQLICTFDVEGSDLDLSGWADVLPDEWPAPETGRGTLKVNGALRGSRLVQLAAHVDLSDVATALPAWTMPLPTALPMQRPANETAEEGAQPEATEDSSVPHGDEPPHPAPEVLSYDRVAFDLKAQRRDDAWHLTLTDLNLVRPESAWRSKQIEAGWSRSADGAIGASGKADRIVLENLWPLLAYLPESENVAHLRALDADGTIENLEFEYQRDPEAASPRYKLRAHLTGVGVSPVNKLPGVGGLGGDVQASEAGGEWRVAASSARFELPRMFRDAMVANTVNGKLSWQRAESGWKVFGEDLDVRSDDGAGLVRFEVNVPRDGSSPVLDLTAQGHDLRVSATSKYIPAGRLGAKTIQWFDRAFVDGRVVNADLVYRGPTRAFPFRNGEGTFLVRGHVENGTLDYQPPWAPAQDVTADVEFRNQGMHIHATAGVVGNLSVSDALADIADLKQTRLLIKASASGALQDGLQLLKDSPIGPKLGERFARLGGSGAIRAQLGLDLPIRDLDDRRIDVTARFADATVTMRGVDPPVKALNGSLTVRNTLLASADLQAQWMDAPLHVTVEPVGGDQSMLDARGHASAEQLQELLGLPPAIRLSGATDWHLAAKLQAGGNEEAAQRNTFDIDSRLEGLAIGLPHPFGKNADDAKPLRASLQFDGDDVLLARASLGDVRSLIRLRRPQQTWELDRGGVRPDGIAPALPDHRGLRIEGAVDRFVLDDWIALKGSESGGKPLSYYLQAANVSVGSFEMFGYRWPDVRGMLQATPSGWRVDVDGPNAAGQILIPETFTGMQPVRVTLDRLVLDPAQSGSEQQQDSSDPRKLPNIQFYVGDLRFGTRSIGAVDLKASRVPQGISFDSATIIGNAVRAQARGKWLVTTDGPESSLNATITTTDVATTLRALGYGEVMQAKHGEVRADLSWPGGYNARFLEHASGAISVDAQTGQLVTVQPGAGRVLGLFSVAALPRRLALDFSDLTEKGLAFDTVHGDFELRDGNAYTSNLLLRGPAAEIGIAGRTGLATHDYDQTAIVTGNLGVSVPVAGALAGGPAIGAALLLFTQVFKEPLKGIARGYYRITGPWEDPVVERVDASDIKAEVTRER